LTPTSSPGCWPPPPAQNRESSGRLRARLFSALVCTFLGMSWQLLTVHYNFDGNLTALFCTGTNLPIPPALEREHIYRFPHSTGYDGQAYHFMAHDPLYRTEVGHVLFPDAGHRYRRILLPAVAYAMALGRQDWIDESYFLCNLAFLFVGAWWLATILVRLGIHPGFAVLYLLVPATLISLDRLTVDLALTSLSLGFVVYANAESRWPLYVVLVLAALCRDTGFILAMAAAIPPLVSRRYRASLFWLSALLPAIVWYAFVRWRVGPGAPDAAWPLYGVWESIRHPMQYPFPPAMTAGVRVFDGLQTLGQLLGIGLALRRWKEAAVDPMRVAVVLWAILGICLPISTWSDFYSAARVFSPLLLFEFLRSIPEGSAIERLPLLMVSPRIWIQLLPQVGGVLRAIVAG
jgi:hypothetical protein